MAAQKSVPSVPITDRLILAAVMRAQGIDEIELSKDQLLEPHELQVNRMMGGGVEVRRTEAEAAPED